MRSIAPKHLENFVCSDIFATILQRHQQLEELCERSFTVGASLGLPPAIGNRGKKTLNWVRSPDVRRMIGWNVVVGSTSSRSIISFPTAISYFTPQVSTKSSKAALATFFVSAIQIFCRSDFCILEIDYGIALSTLAVL